MGINWSKLFLNTFYGVCGLTGIALGLLYHFQEKLLYVPQLPGIPREYEALPDEYDMDYKDIWFGAKDGIRLHCWKMWRAKTDPNTLKSLPTVIFFQANAGNISHRLPLFNRLLRHIPCILYAISYRGYGLSTGSPSELGLQMDGEAMMNYILETEDETVNKENIFLFGRSLGGAVAIHVASKFKDKLKGVIIENTFISVVEMVPQVLPFLGSIIGRRGCGNFLVRNKWENNKKIKEIYNLPILMLVSQKDEIVPPVQMEALYELRCDIDAFTNLVKLPGASHMNAFEICPTIYWPAIKNFILSDETSSQKT